MSVGEDVFGPIEESKIRISLELYATIPRIDGAAARIQQLVDAPDGLARFYAVDDTGLIHVIENGNVLDTPALDLRGRDDFRAGHYEAGLRSFAFHPDFADPDAAGYGRVYTSHVAPIDSRPETVRVLEQPRGANAPVFDAVIAEWRLTDPSDPLTVDPGSKRELLRIEQPFENHNVNQILFDPNLRPGDPGYGLLYVGSADGGSQWDPFDLARDLASPSGKILRIDPLEDHEGQPYGIPADNPFVGTEDALGEIWALGFRNPQTLAFDIEGTRSLLVGDIGQNRVEEINVVLAGGNYGWGDREGPLRLNGASAEFVTGDDDYQYPITGFDHEEAPWWAGLALGGIYRGTAMPELSGHVLFTDFVSGRVYHADMSGLGTALADGRVSPDEFVPPERLQLELDGRDVTLGGLIGNVVGRVDARLGVDENNEVYVFGKQRGEIYRLASSEAPPTVTEPATPAPEPPIEEPSSDDGADFLGGVLPSGQIVFAPGEVERILTIAVQGNSDVEPDEDFRVTLINADNATIVKAITDAVVRNGEVPSEGEIDFGGFEDATGLNLNGSAAVVDGFLRLTPLAGDQAGSAFFDQALAIGADTSFATQFSFRIGGGDGADGFAFVLQNDAAGSFQGSQALGANGWTLGLGGRLGIEGIHRSVAITFDTFQNPFDVSDNQIALVIDGRVQARTGTRVALPTDVFDLNGGEIGHAWIEYDGSTNEIRVFVGSSPTKPDDAVLTATVDLAGVVGDQAFVGFTAATGDNDDEHDILSWAFLQDLEDRTPTRSVAIAPLEAPAHEGDDGATSEFTFTVSRSGDLDVFTTVDWSVESLGGSASVEKPDAPGDKPTTDEKPRESLEEPGAPVDEPATLPREAELIGAVQQVSLSGLDPVVAVFPTQLENALVFAGPLSTEVRESVTPRVTALDRTSATLRLEGPTTLEATFDGPMDLTLVTLREGVWQVGDGQRLEVGRVMTNRLVEQGFVAVDFATPFDDTPAVVVQLQTFRGPDWTIVRIDEVDRGGFTLALQEEEARGGFHGNEIVGWFAMDAGVFDWNGLDAQAFRTDAIVGHEGGEVAFDDVLGDAPLFAAGLASTREVDPATLRLAGLADGKATFVAYEEQTRDAEMSHMPEIVSGVAFSGTGVLTGSDLLLG